VTPNSVRDVLKTSASGLANCRYLSSLFSGHGGDPPIPFGTSSKKVPPWSQTVDTSRLFSVATGVTAQFHSGRLEKSCLRYLSSLSRGHESNHGQHPNSSQQKRAPANTVMNRCPNAAKELPFKYSWDWLGLGGGAVASWLPARFGQLPGAPSPGLRGPRAQRPMFPSAPTEAFG